MQKLGVHYCQILRIIYSRITQWNITKNILVLPLA